MKTKVLLLGLLIFLLHAFPVNAEEVHGAEEDPRVSGQIGFGAGNAGLTKVFSFTKSSEGFDLTFRFTHASDKIVLSNNIVSEKAVLYGKRIQYSGDIVLVSIGLGVTNSSYKEFALSTGSAKSSTGIGLPIELKFVNDPRSRFGLSFIGNINNAKTFFAIVAGVRFGKL